MVITRPNLFSIAAASVAFIALDGLISWATTVSTFWNHFNIVAYVASGFVVGFMSPRDSFIGGSILGILTVPIDFAISYALSMDYSVTPTGLLIATIAGVLFCCAGAVVGDIIARQR